MPIYSAGKGSTRVTVNPHGPRFVVTWYDTTGTRKRRTLPVKTQAIEFAQSVAREIAGGRHGALALNDADLAEITAARRAMESAGVPFLSGVQEYTRARSLLSPGESLVAVVRDAVASRRTSGPVPPTIEAVTQCLQFRAQRGRSRRHISELSGDLREFARAFPDFRTAQPDALENWLHSLRTRKARTVDGILRPVGSPLSMRRRDNIRDSVALFLNFCQLRGWLGGGPTAAAAVPRLASGPEVVTLTPSLFAQVLTWFESECTELLPWVVLGGFAGMRSSEVLRLEWSALRWNAGVITVTAKVAGKVRVGRKIPIHPALREWLAPWSAHTMGRVIAATPEPSRAISRAFSRMCKALSWTHWPINALRHSYGSHRLAAVSFDFAQVANEMGTSPAMLRKHYINPPDPSDGEAYWSIRPARTAGIVPISAIQ